jgi:hypothetical protein
MKRFLSMLLWLLLMPTLFAAVNVKLQWDAKLAGDTRTNVRIYERTGAVAPYTYTQVAEVAEPTVLATIPNVAPGTHTYIARAWNGQQESADSNAPTAIILVPPGTITNVTITIVVQ